MKRIRNISLLIMILLILKGFSQVGTVFQPGDYRDGIYAKENTTNRRFIPYTFLREADVQWTKRVWRRIDLREKINQPLYYPLDYVTSRMSLIQVLQKALVSGELLAFSDEEFLSPLTVAEVKKKFIHCDSATNQDVDASGNAVETRVWRCDSGEAVLSNVLRYSVKEDWVFDKQKSVLEVRILGICMVSTWKIKVNIKIGFGFTSPPVALYLLNMSVITLKTMLKGEVLMTYFGNDYLIALHTKSRMYMTEILTSMLRV